MMTNQQTHNTDSTKPNRNEERSEQQTLESCHPPFDWVRFWIRFVFGTLPGALFGFGFWIQMCRPAGTVGLMEYLPRLVTEWLGLEGHIDSGLACIMVIVVFGCISGLIVAVWPSISKRSVSI